MLLEICECFFCFFNVLSFYCNIYKFWLDGLHWTQCVCIVVDLHCCHYEHIFCYYEFSRSGEFDIVSLAHWANHCCLSSPAGATSSNWVALVSFVTVLLHSKVQQFVVCIHNYSNNYFAGSSNDIIVKFLQAKQIEENSFISMHEKKRASNSDLSFVKKFSSLKCLKIEYIFSC